MALRRRGRLAPGWTSGGLTCLVLLLAGCAATASAPTRTTHTQGSGDGARGQAAEADPPGEAAAPPVGPGDEGPPPGTGDASLARFDSADIPFRGNPDAAVVVQVFSDFECPFCGLARRHTERLLADFPSVRVEYRHFPLAMHEYAGMAAEASVEAYAQGGPESFWCFHDQVFDHQRNLSRAALGSFAARCGVDQQALLRAIDDGRHAARVERDRAEGTQLGVQGTPTFTVNGVVVEGGDYPDLEEAVDRVHPAW